MVAFAVYGFQYRSHCSRHRALRSGDSVRCQGSDEPPICLAEASNLPSNRSSQLALCIMYVWHDVLAPACLPPLSSWWVHILLSLRPPSSPLLHPLCTTCRCPSGSTKARARCCCPQTQSLLTWQPRGMPAWQGQVAPHQQQGQVVPPQQGQRQLITAPRAGSGASWAALCSVGTCWQCRTGWRRLRRAADAAGSCRQIGKHTSELQSH